MSQVIFSQKGFMGASISEIAKKSGVSNSVIYYYYKNKKELLFSALSNKLNDIEKDLRLHLEAITNPVSKLSKIIWFHSNINKLCPANTGILKNLLIECLSDKDYFHHKEYNVFKNYIGILADILRQGVEQKIFRPDINVILISNLIFTLLIEESLFLSYSSQNKSTSQDFLNIVEFVLSIITKTNSDSITYEKDKEKKILKAALHKFADKGYHATTVSEIAKVANLSEGTIYRYFNNKRDILFSISRKWFKTLKDSKDEVFHIRCPIKKLSRFIRLFFITFSNNKNFLKVFLFDIKLNNFFYRSPSYREYFEYISLLDVILEEGKEKGVFKRSTDPRLFRSFVIGAFVYFATKCVVLENTKHFDIILEIEELVSIICRSVIIDSESLYCIEGHIKYY